LGNHDESRLATRYSTHPDERDASSPDERDASSPDERDASSPDERDASSPGERGAGGPDERDGRVRARLAAMLLLTLRGTPTLYYGDEIGMTDVPIPPDRRQDPWGLRVEGQGRDPCRTPMQWRPAPNAGFSAPGTPGLWLPLAPDYREVNVERQLADPTSILNLYRRLLAYRKANAALQRGSYQALDLGPQSNGGVPETCYVFERRAGQERVVVALNFSAQDQRVTLPSLEGATVVLSTHLDREEQLSRGELVLRGDEGVIVELD
jgi:alpha-glucosidase